MSPRFAVVAALPFLVATSGDVPRPAGAATGSEGGAASAFVKLEKVEVPIFGNSRIEGRITAQLILQMTAPDQAASATRQMPELRGHVVETMLEFGSLYASGFSAVDAERLSAALNAAIKARNASVRRVLIVELTASPV